MYFVFGILSSYTSPSLTNNYFAIFSDTLYFAVCNFALEVTPNIEFNITNRSSNKNYVTLTNQVAYLASIGVEFIEPQSWIVGTTGSPLGRHSRSKENPRHRAT